MTDPIVFKDYFPGIYLGEVEYTNDPAQMGRIRVRVPTIDDVNDYCSTQGLPWAFPCFPYSGADGMGSIMVPPEGSSVWVMFQKGDPNRRVYLGGYPGVRNNNKEFLRNAKKTLPDGAISMSPDKNTTWVAPPGPEAPAEYVMQDNLRPERVIPFKTIKGASIDINDADEEEALSIHDRSGQCLVFESQVSSDANKQNRALRGLKSASRGTQLETSQLLTESSKILLKDIAGQYITLETNKNDNKIILSSKTSKQTEVEGSSEVKIELLSDQNKIEITLTKEGKKKASFSLDGVSGSAEIVSPSFVKIDSENVVINGHLLVNGKLTVSDDIVALGDVVTNNLIESTTISKVSSQIEEPSI